MAQTNDGYLMRRQALDDIIDRDIGRATNEDALLAGEELKD